MDEIMVTVPVQLRLKRPVGPNAEDGRLICLRVEEALNEALADILENDGLGDVIALHPIAGTHNRTTTFAPKA